MAADALDGVCRCCCSRCSISSRCVYSPALQWYMRVGSKAFPVACSLWDFKNSVRASVSHLLSNRLLCLQLQRSCGEMPTALRWTCGRWAWSSTSCESINTLLPVQAYTHTYILKYSLLTHSHQYISFMVHLIHDSHLTQWHNVKVCILFICFPQTAIKLLMLPSNGSESDTLLWFLI